MQLFNGQPEPNWLDPEVQRQTREIVINIFCRNQAFRSYCMFCGAQMKSAHGRGCEWAAAAKLFGIDVNQK